ncbi:hypothetical protein LUZ60_002134 [Juncus effusus]|nr:hypothetical protein LUZ60_002134 [Juncus effusus]
MEGHQARGHIACCLSRIRTVKRDNIALAEADGCNLTGHQFVHGVLQLASGLSEAGIRIGDVVAIAALNSKEYVELFLAVTYIGAIVSPLNHRWSFEEAKIAMELVQPKMLAVDMSCVFWAQEMKNDNHLSSINLYVLLRDSSPSQIFPFLTIDEIKRSSKNLTLNEPVSAPREVALICFTSGTTGNPKGVAITHTSLIVQSLAKISIVRYGENDVYLHMASLCHIGGISSFLAVLMAGGCHILMPKFDSKLAFQCIKEHKVTSFITVPAIMADLISHARKQIKLDGIETVTKILNGGGGLSEDLIKGSISLFPNSTILSAYGMTEACSSLTIMTLRDPKLQKFTPNPQNKFIIKSKPTVQDGIHVGKPAPHIELRINVVRKSTTEKNAPLVGRIMTRGLHVMAGYWVGNNEKFLGIDENNWLDTGDIGWIDGSGDLWLLGRKKDRIKTGGENVYPEEVEAVLCQHEAVEKIVVIGIPDSRLSEKVVACVLLNEKWKWVDRNSNNISFEKVVSPRILRDFCAERNLTRFKIPKNYVIWTESFPVTTTGKIRREEVRRQVMASLQFCSKL